MSIPLSEAVKALDKAKDAIETAEYNIQGDFILAAINSAYYAMFYCMTALLYTKEVYAKTHIGTRAKFNERFIQPGIIQPFLLKYVQAAFNARQTADYDMDAAMTKEEALTIIANAKTLYETTKDYLLPFTSE